jgi:hypothetical protein
MTGRGNKRSCGLRTIKLTAKGEVMPLRQWTPRDELRLHAMIAEGKPIDQIAAELKRL